MADNNQQSSGTIAPGDNASVPAIDSLEAIGTMATGDTDDDADLGGKPGQDQGDDGDVSGEEPTSDDKESEDGGNDEDDGDPEDVFKQLESLDDADTQTKQEDGNPDSAWVESAVDELLKDGLTKERESEIRNGLRKKVDLAESQRATLKNYQALEEALVGNAETSASVIRQMAEYAAGALKVPVAQLLGATPQVNSDAGTTNSETKSVTEQLKEALGPNAYDGELALAEQLGPVIDGLREQVQKLEAELGVAKSESAKTQEAKTRAAQLQAQYPGVKRLISKEFQGFDLSKQDYVDSIKARPDLKPEDATRIFLSKKLSSHVAEVGRRSGGNPVRPMVKSPTSKPSVAPVKVEALSIADIGRLATFGEDD